MIVNFTVRLNLSCRRKQFYPFVENGLSHSRTRRSSEGFPEALIYFRNTPPACLCSAAKATNSLLTICFVTCCCGTPRIRAIIVLRICCRRKLMTMVTTKVNIIDLFLFNLYVPIQLPSISFYYTQEAILIWKRVQNPQIHGMRH